MLESAGKAAAILTYANSMGTAKEQTTISTVKPIRINQEN